MTVEIVEDPQTRASALSLLRGVSELPTSFSVLQRALELLGRDECTNDALQEVLLADPATAAGIMKLANSAYFGVATRVRTPATAIRVVGHRRLETMLRHLLAGKLLELLAAEQPEAETVRDTALTAAAIASKLADESTCADELRLTGLLHNISELALLSVAPGEYREALLAAEHAGERQDAARVRLGLSFAEASAQLLEYWRFPADQVAVVKHWPNPWEVWPEGRRAPLCVHVAARLAAELLGVEAALVEQRTLEALGIEPERLAQIQAEAPHAVEEMRAWLL